MIPLILSQTWKTHDLPEQARTLQHGWRLNNPELDYRFYDDAACRAVIAETFPEFLDAYDRLPFGVMRADAFRYAIVYRDGGIYADIDMECLKPVVPLLAKGSCLVSVEARLGGIRQRELGYLLPFQVANCIFAAEPHHRFFADAFRQCFVDPDKARNATLDQIEDITGPRMLTRLLFSGNYPEVTVLPQILLMGPTNYPDRWPLNLFMHTRHRTFGAWKNETFRTSLWRQVIERNRMPNPFARQPLAMEKLL